jgi:hypothetical protein
MTKKRRRHHKGNRLPDLHTRQTGNPKLNADDSQESPQEVQPELLCFQGGSPAPQHPGKRKAETKRILPKRRRS